MKADTVLEEAADWWLRLREPNVPPETIAEWMRWCDRDAEHLIAFESVQDLWQKAAAAPLVSPAPARKGVAGVAWRWALAAGVSALLAGAGYWFELRLAGPAPIATAIGKIREVKLPDGSKVTLGGATALRAAFTAERREVRLEHGEAYFKVQKDVRRPFVVMTSSATITALGTAFNVRSDEDVLKVTVTEGAVAVGSTRLEVGQQATVLRTVTSITVHKVDPKVASAWTGGTLKFMDEPLESVVAAVNRYSPQTIELRRKGLEGLRYTGTVVAGRIDEWLAALPNAFPVKVVQEEHEVRLERRNF